MKKLLALLLVLVLVFSVVACSKPEEKKEEPKQEEKKEEAKEEKKEEPKEEASIKVGFITDTGGIDDKSFNQSTWEGIQKFKADMGLPEDSVSFLQSNTEADYNPNLAQLADKKLNVIVAAGFKFTDAIAQAATDYPEQHFLIIDSVVDSPNVISAVFAEHEGSYLVGLAAGLKMKEAGQTVAGFVGGEDFDIIQKFEAGFEQGVKAIDPSFEVKVEYAGSFVDAAKGQTVASKLYDSGAYVIYHAAGNAGNGVIKEAKDRVQSGKDVWACGVDRDQYEEGVYEDGKSVILTSMLKRVDTAAYDVCKLEAENKFKGGVMVFSLENNGVSLPAENPNLKPEWIKTIDEYKEKIINKEIEVGTTPIRKQ